MKDLKSILKECSIKEIYCDNHGAPITYVIPISNVTMRGNEMKSVL